MGLIQNLKSTGFNFKKSLGQNFIVDQGYLESVVSQLGLTPQDIVVEVGTGAGTLTRVIARQVAKVITIEIDKSLENILKEQFSGLTNIQLVFDDVMKIKSLEQLAGGKEFKLVANVPYYITTPILLKFIRDQNCADIAVLVQEELARRIVAKPGGKDYGALSITMQAYANCKIVKRVSRNMFTPTPNVDSAFVQATKIQGSEQTCFDALSELVKGLFSARRKTVLNGLSSLYGISKDRAGEILAEAGIDVNIRPEQVSVAQYLNLVSKLAGPLGIQRNPLKR